MKRSKRIIILAAVLIVASAATFALTKYEKKQEEIKNSDDIILKIKGDSVTSVSWKNDDSELAFHKDDDKWIYDKDEAFPVSEDAINNMLSHFEEFGASFSIDNVDDYGQYGLDDPQCVLNISTEKKDYELKIGDYSKMDEQRYVDIGDGKVYLVSEDPVSFLETELSGVIANDTTPAFEKVKKIVFSGKADYTINYKENSKKTYSDSDVYFTKIGGETQPVDSDKISTYLSTISSLSLTNYVTYNATDDELKSYGLDDPEFSVKVDYTYTDDDNNEISDSCVLHVGQNQEELAKVKKAKESKKDEEVTVTKYVRIGDSKIIYQLDDFSYDVLAACTYDDLRHSQVIWADSDDITQIDVTLEGQKHVIKSKENKDADKDSDSENDKSRVWYYDDKKIDIADIKTALVSLKADSFTDEKANQQEEISLTVHLDNENYKEVKIVFYRYNGKYCLAQVDGKSVSLVNRADVMALVEAVQAIVLE